ncbi:MAG: response regulator, partial [Dissulfurispiraceae bacterium]
MTLLNPSILIVDDEEIILSSCLRILSAEEYTLDTAENAGIALEKLRKSHFDLVLTDIIMPGATGMDLLKKIKEEQP